METMVTSVKGTESSMEATASGIVREATTSPRRSGNEAIIAYVHQLSPIKRNKKNTIDYSTLLLQTKDEEPQEALLYSKHKRPLLVDSEKCRTPVKIQRFTYTSDGEKIIINDMTKISVPGQTEYSFQFKESVMPSRTQPVSIEDILSRTNEWENVTLSGKVVRVGEISTVGAKQLKLAETTFADSTGTIVVDIWEQHIPMIENGKVYRIAPVQVRSWAGKKKLSTTVRSIVTEIADDTLSKVFVSEEDLNTVDFNEVTVKVSNIHSVQAVETFIHCLNKYCSRRLLQPSAGKIVHCDRCGYTMRSSNCTKQVCAKIVIQLESGEQVNLTAFQSVLNRIFEGEISSLSETDVAEKLLLLEELTIRYNSDTQIITELQL